MEKLGKTISWGLYSNVEEQLLSTIRILVADDYKDWRSQTLRLLQGRPEFRVVCEASDGPEAVQKAQELKPDLILLDIGLPMLNGVEAARQILQLSPGSKIVFLSLHDSPDVVQGALSTGALGYVLKTDAASELLSAMDAALGGKRFVSSSLKAKGYEFTKASSEKAAHRHEVQFYSDDAVFLDCFAHFVAVALKAGDAAIVFTTGAHRDALVRRIKAHGLDVDAVTRQGTYIHLDVAESLSKFMVNDMPDTARFLEAVGVLIEAATKAGKGEHSRVVACGECSPLLWAEGKLDAAIRLEQLFDEIAATNGVDILCAYPLRSFQGKQDEHAFQSICAVHSAASSQ